MFRLLRALEKAEQQLKHRFDEIPGMNLKRHVSRLDSGQRFVRKLHKQLVQAIEYEESIDESCFDE